MRRVSIVLALVATAASGATPRLEVPEEVSFFDAPAIRVTGLQPMVPITIRATLVDLAGASYTSSARFVPHTDGIVDTTRTIANGGYTGVDPMGLFWSMQGKGTLQLPKTGTIETTIDALDEDGKPFATAKLLRRIVPADVTVTELRRPESELVGRYYEHAGGKRAAILTLTGSNGGIDERMAPFLASRGYNVLAVAYFHFEGVPDNLIEIPLEYFQTALQWLGARASADATRMGIVGVSKGAEAALLTASHYPNLVHAVAAVVPTHVVWEGADARARFGGDPHFDSPDQSSWSFEGKPLPFVHKFVSPERLAKRPVAFLDEYETPLEGSVNPSAIIPVERIHAPIFLATAGDDLAWPSQKMGREIRKRLDARHFAYPVELREYPMSGHPIIAPGFRATDNLGGTTADTAHAGIDAWTRIAKFFDQYLGSNSAGSRKNSKVEIRPHLRGGE